MTSVSASPMPTVFVRRLHVRGFRSLAECDVQFGSLTVLVGFNASGKSNLLDSLRFVADAFATSPERAVEVRGGLEALLYQSGGDRAETLRIDLELALRAGDTSGEVVPASYWLEIGRDPSGAQPLMVHGQGASIEVGRFEATPEASAPVTLPLPALMTGTANDFAQVEVALRWMRFYDFDTSVLRALDESTTRHTWLGPAGEHLGRMLGALAREDPVGKERLDAYLSALVPNAIGIDERREGRYSTVEARFRARGEAWSPEADIELVPRESLSEGTLRATGVLTALMQRLAHEGRISLVGIEEPEAALHPATVGALYEALDDASRRSQVIVTSQSSALLDSEYADIDHLRVVENVGGATVVGEVDAAGRTTVDQGLMSLGELHASGQMRPVMSARPRI